jgi:integrase
MIAFFGSEISGSPAAAARVTRPRQSAQRDGSARTLKLAEFVADEQVQRRAWSAFDGDDSRVFCHPESGNALNPQKYARILRAALAKAGIGDLVRPTHDLRVTTATNGWLAGMSKAALQGRLGHVDFKVTERYINAAGELYPDDARRLEERLVGFGRKVGTMARRPRSSVDRAAVS